ncbi:MAG: hypothetical protein K2H59_07955 [Muribaculaceae bacterium]|nr:hypothetical protein [Muribaculaceae bacterium]
MKSKHGILSILLIILTCGIVACSNHNHQATMNCAESLMDSAPDSALKILRTIDKSDLGSKAEKARYALLMSMALDKNYIDTTNFNVLQPAIDYYLKKGSPNDKLRTYYYQGRIYDNKGEQDSALNSFVKAIDNIPGSTDSLCMARAHVSAGLIYFDFYDFESYIKNYLKAAQIYKKKNKKDFEFDALINALNGAIILKQKNLGDSLISCIYLSYDSLSEIQKNKLQGRILTYKTMYGTEAELKDLIETHGPLLKNNIQGMLNLASAHRKIGNNLEALKILNDVRNSGIEYDTLKFLATSVYTYKNLGDYKNAFINYWDFRQISEIEDFKKFEQKSKSIEEKHKLEIQAQKEAREKNNIIWACIGGFIFLVLSILILLLLVRSRSIQKDLAIQKAKNIQLENDNLKSERDKKTLEAENLAHRVAILENESESLKKLLESSNEIPTEVQDAIKIRVEMLNTLLASYITANDSYGNLYDKWVKEITENTAEFMNSNRLAFQASHPRFIQYFEDHGLTIDEINYVCLYALGLRGKEVGNYIKKRSHVNMSSAIRKKLSIDKHETNIGIYVRRLLQNS